MSGPEWWFYHLERPPLARALGPLLEKCLERKWRVLMSCPDTSALEAIDKDLWNWRDDAFTPHGLSGEADAHQPILLSDNLSNANSANVLMLLNAQDAPSNAPFERIMAVFEDGDPSARGKARSQYKAAKDAGLTVRYFKQSSGGWAEQK